MAKSKMGSRCLDALYQSAPFQLKETITRKLAEHEKELKKDYFGKFAIINCKVDQYLIKADVWKAAAQSQDRKRKLFEDILNDDGLVEEPKKQKIEQPDLDEENEKPKKNTALKDDHDKQTADILSLFQNTKKTDKKEKKSEKRDKKAKKSEKKAEKSTEKRKNKK